MDNLALLALVDSLVEDAIKNISTLEGPQGPRGLKGKDGNDFDLEFYKENIISLIEEHSNITLTADQIESLQGTDGKDGQDGKDGNSVYIEEVLQDIVPLVHNRLDEIKESLRLKFSDLSDEERDSLRGSRGQRGKPGKDFSFEESFESIKSILTEYASSIRDELKLKFKDLTEEDKESLKLKFSDFSEEEVLKLRGSRGQRGKPGSDGEHGLNAFQLAKESGFEGSLEDWIISLRGAIGSRGVPGIPGVQGLRGFDGLDGIKGLDGKDGLDAPIIVDVIVEQINTIENEYVIILIMSDGSRIESNYFKLPKSQILQQFIGGGGGGGSQLIISDEGVELGSTTRMNFVGDGVEVTQEGEETIVTFSNLSGSNMRQTILDSEDRQQDLFYEDFGTRNERITRIDYYSPSLSGFIARKEFIYLLEGTNYKRTNITWEIITV